MVETIRSNENSYESSLDNLKEVDYVKVKVEENLHSLAKDAATQLFYTLDTENDKVVYNMDTVKDFLSKAKDNLSSQDKNVVMMAVQIMLESKGYDVGKIDGLFGVNTANAVRAFQRTNGLKVDGDPGVQTITKLLGGDSKEYSGGNSSNTHDNRGENAGGGQVSNENYEQLGKGEMSDELFKSIDNSKLVNISGGKVKLKDEIEKTEGGRKYIEINGTKFYEWSENCNGLRYQIEKDGTRFCVGEFKDGKSNGKGKCVWSDGDVYEGEFKDGKMNGYGKYVFANKDEYEGEFKDGKMNGYGKKTICANGGIREQYEGIFRADKYDQAQTEYYKKNCDAVLKSMYEDVVTVDYRSKKIGKTFEGNKDKYQNKTTYEESDFINDVYKILAKYVNLTWKKGNDGKYTWILDYSKYPNRGPWKDKAVPSKYFRDLNRADEFTKKISYFIDKIKDRRDIKEINKPKQII